MTDDVLYDRAEFTPADEILDRADQVDRYDRLARRNYGLDHVTGGTGTRNVAVFAGGRAIVQITDARPKIVERLTGSEPWAREYWPLVMAQTSPIPVAHSLSESLIPALSDPQ